MQDNNKIIKDEEKIENINNAVEENKSEHHEKGGKHHREHHSKIEKLEKEIEEYKKEIEKLKQEANDYKDAYLRKAAEFDNYKKRVLKEMDDMRLFANKNLMLELIPVYDNLSRAINNAETNKDFNCLYEGLKITLSQFENIFKNNNVEKIDSVGKDFDINLHEALLIEEKEDLERDNIILEELDKGYTMGGKVLKTAKVKVGKKKIIKI